MTIISFMGHYKRIDGELVYFNSCEQMQEGGPGSGRRKTGNTTTKASTANAQAKADKAAAAAAKKLASQQAAAIRKENTTAKKEITLAHRDNKVKTIKAVKVKVIKNKSGIKVHRAIMKFPKGAIHNKA